MTQIPQTLSSGFVDSALRFATAATELRDKMAMAALFVAAEQGTVSVDDLRDVLNVLNPDFSGDKRFLGAVLGELKRKGVIVGTGWTPTREPRSHGRPISVFALTQDWRSAWTTKTSFPALNVVLNLKPKVDVAAKQVDQEEVFTILSEVCRLATQALDDPLVGKPETLAKIKGLTERWR